MFDGRALVTSYAHHVQERLGGSGWWSQTVAVGYERIRGLRAIGQRHDGSYAASKSRTFAVPVAQLFEAFADEAQRQLWLPGVALVIKKATPHKTIRITWDDGTPVEVYFTPKGDDKSNLAVEHGKDGLVGGVVAAQPGQVVEAEVVVRRRGVAPVGLEQVDAVGAGLGPEPLRPGLADGVACLATTGATSEPNTMVSTINHEPNKRRVRIRVPST